jgi:hypothetical protein
MDIQIEDERGILLPVHRHFLWGVRGQQRDTRTLPALNGCNSPAAASAWARSPPTTRVTAEATSGSGTAAATCGNTG